MSYIFPHQMFQADFLTMLPEVRRQEELDPAYSEESTVGSAIFFFFGEDVLPLIKRNDWVYEAARRFAQHFADEYFIALRLLNAVEESQNRLTKLRGELTEVIMRAGEMGLAPGSVKIAKPSDFIDVIETDKLPSSLKATATRLYEEALDLELLYVNAGSQAIQAMYEKAFPRIFYVVRRALKEQMNSSATDADDRLLEAHQYLNWCHQHLSTDHTIVQVFVKHRTFYKVTRNVDSHVKGPQWLPETNQVLLPDRDNQLIVDVSEFSQRYRYLMYFCEIGARGILSVFCDRERGPVSNDVAEKYLKMYENPELQARFRRYPT